MAKITASELKSILSSLSSYSKAAIFVLNKPYDLSDNFVVSIPPMEPPCRMRMASA